MRVRRSLAVVAAAGMMAVGVVASAQPAAAPTGATVVRSSNPSKDNLAKLQKLITADFDGTRFEDAIKNIAEQTGAELDVLYKNDRGDGLDPEAQVKLSEKNTPALTVITKLLSKVAPDERDEATWQFSAEGKVQVGRKADLDKFKRVEIYSILDLLLRLPIYPDVPEVNLQQALQSGGRGGGGGQSPFTQNQQNRQRQPEQIERERKDRSAEIITLLTQYAEPNRWISGGGDLQNPRYFDGNIIVDAPDYVHRALVGYSWWPSTKSVQSSGRRYVSLSQDSAIASVANFRTLPVTAGVAGGPPGGGR